MLVAVVRVGRLRQSHVRQLVAAAVCRGRPAVHGSHFISQSHPPCEARRGGGRAARPARAAAGSVARAGAESAGSAAEGPNDISGSVCCLSLHARLPRRAADVRPPAPRGQPHCPGARAKVTRAVSSRARAPGTISSSRSTCRATRSPSAPVASTSAAASVAQYKRRAMSAALGGASAPRSCPHNTHSPPAPQTATVCVRTARRMRRAVRPATR